MIVYYVLQLFWIDNNCSHWNVTDKGSIIYILNDSGYTLENYTYRDVHSDRAKSRIDVLIIIQFI